MSGMRAVRLHEWGGDLEAERVPVPDVEPAEVLVDVEATGVGLTVHNAVRGHLGGRDADLPRVPGHEVVGTVADCGTGVTGIEAGERVVAYFYLTCGRCHPCLSGNQNLCENHAGYVGVDVDGGYADFVALPRENVVSIPDTIDPVDATTIPDAIGTPYHVATQRARVGRGDDVMVLGAGGGVGIHLLQVARYFGADVTAVDRSHEKLAACEDLGAVATIDTDRDRLPDAVPHDSYDAIVDFTGSMDLVETANDLLGPRGRLVHLTAFPGREMAANPRAMVPRESAILGSRYCTKSEIVRSAGLVADGHVAPVVSEVVDLEGVPDLLDSIADGDVVGRAAATP